MIRIAKDRTDRKAKYLIEAVSQLPM
jgi:hypothetical protein